MQRAVFLNKLEEIMAEREGLLKGDEKIAELTSWDSMAAVQFMAFADENFGVTISAADLLQVKTISDLEALLGNKITA